MKRPSKTVKINGVEYWNPAYLRHRRIYGQRSPSKYTPHQGKKECARRVRQAQRLGIA